MPSSYHYHLYLPPSPRFPLLSPEEKNLLNFQTRYTNGTKYPSIPFPSGTEIVEGNYIGTRRKHLAKLTSRVLTRVSQTRKLWGSRFENQRLIGPKPTENRDENEPSV